MSIVLAILKWIGIALGGILGLLLFALILFFLVPVRYYAACEKQEGKMLYSFRFSWLLRLLSLEKRNASSSLQLYVLGIPIKNLSEGKEKKEEKKKKPEREEEKKEEKTAKNSGGEPPEKTTAPPKRRRKPEGKDTEKKNIGRRKKKKRFSFGKVSSIISIVREAENKAALQRLKKEIVGCIRYLAPQRIRGRLLIGTGNPASTGLLFGGISLFPFAYQKGVQISPDFDEKVFEAEGYIKGRVRMLYLIRLFIRLYRDRELRMLWNTMNQMNEKEAA